MPILSRRNNGGLVSCNLTLYYYSSGYAQLGFLLRDWVPHANLLNASGVVLLGSRNTNGKLQHHGWKTPQILLLVC